MPRAVTTNVNEAALSSMQAMLSVTIALTAGSNVVGNLAELLAKK
jgi:hypothetical protein